MWRSAVVLIEVTNGIWLDMIPILYIVTVLSIYLMCSHILTFMQRPVHPSFGWVKSHAVYTFAVQMSVWCASFVEPWYRLIYIDSMELNWSKIHLANNMIFCTDLFDIEWLSKHIEKRWKTFLKGPNNLGQLSGKLLRHSQKWATAKYEFNIFDSWYDTIEKLYTHWIHRVWCYQRYASKSVVSSLISLETFFFRPFAWTSSVWASCHLPRHA